MEPKFQVQLKIQKPVAEVFDAVVKPEKLTGYFIHTTTGPLETGKTVKWKFQEVPHAFDVIVREVVPLERIVFAWPTAQDYNTTVEMTFKPLDAANTLVQISEWGWHSDEAGVKSSYGNAGGWMHMMTCMKAYLEYGINLRSGGVR
jgi:uncharacterized protein YndB with AHSA1/START domain